MTIPPIEAFINIKHSLPATGTWRKSVHVFDERTAQAIRASLASGRPLLVRGDPGTGKSQLARAAAKVMGRKFLSQVVDAHTEIQDLWYRFDAISRLGNAQILSVTGEGKKVEEVLNPEAYLSPGILWWAFDWQTAKARKSDHPFFTPDEKDPGDEEKGIVLLLDEIDKADTDLPNSLLETLDNGRFTVPWIKETVGVDTNDTNKRHPRPLVVITTNEDRQLPSAFIRRCMVLDLSLPTGEHSLIRFLKERAAYHFPATKEQNENNQPIEKDEQGHAICASRFDDEVITKAAQQLYKDRERADSLSVTKPGQAEYLDMLRVLDELVPNDKAQQIELLETIKEFALQKYPGMQQERKQIEEDE